MYTPEVWPCDSMLNLRVISSIWSIILHLFLEFNKCVVNLLLNLFKKYLFNKINLFHVGEHLYCAVMYKRKYLISHRVSISIARYINVSCICHFANLFNWLLFYEMYLFIPGNVYTRWNWQYLIYSFASICTTQLIVPWIYYFTNSCYEFLFDEIKYFRAEIVCVKTTVAMFDLSRSRIIHE